MKEGFNLAVKGLKSTLTSSLLRSFALASNGFILDAELPSSLNGFIRDPELFTSPLHGGGGAFLFLGLVLASIASMLCS